MARAILVASLFLCPLSPRPRVDLEALREKVSQELIRGEKLEKRFLVNGLSYLVDYTIDPNYQAYIKKLLRRYQSDYAYIVILDNDTGELLASYGHSKKEKKGLWAMGLRPSHPSASLAKIVSLANILENSLAHGKTPITYTGRGSTLYRYQLRNSLSPSRTKRISLRRAFALSNNPAMARASLKYTHAHHFYQMAGHFGFNKKITHWARLPKPFMPYPTDRYNYAELASGFNRMALTSPLHGAYLAFVVANGGMAQNLSLVRKVLGPNGPELWPRPRPTGPVLAPRTLEGLQRSFQEVVRNGTARGLFWGVGPEVRRQFYLGGKTGRITGGVPHGQRDWFVGHATPKDASSRGISFCVMIVNQGKWYVKSTFLSQKIVQYYYRDYMKPKKFAMASMSAEGR